MASGIQVDQNCVDEFNSFKLGKKYSYLLFGFSEDATKITVKHAEPKNYADSDSLKVKNGRWESMVAQLPKDDVLYAVIDVHYNSPAGSRTDMIFITWAPETAHIKRKMLIASSQSALKKALPGVRAYIQATCYPDLDIRSVVDNQKGTLDY